MWYGANYSTKDYKDFVVSMIEKNPCNKQVFLINDDDKEMVQWFFFTSLSFTFIVVSSTEELSPLFKSAHPKRRLSARQLFAGSTLI